MGLAGATEEVTGVVAVFDGGEQLTAGEGSCMSEDRTA